MVIPLIIQCEFKMRTMSELSHSIRFPILLNNHVFYCKYENLYWCSFVTFLGFRFVEAATNLSGSPTWKRILSSGNRQEDSEYVGCYRLLAESRGAQSVSEIFIFRQLLDFFPWTTWKSLSLFKILRKRKINKYRRPLCVMKSIFIVRR